MENVLSLAIYAIWKNDFTNGYIRQRYINTSEFIDTNDHGNPLVDQANDSYVIYVQHYYHLCGIFIT